MESRRHPERLYRHLASLPFIYMMIVPIFILDVFIELYHHICFPLYGLPLIERGRYIKIDRYKLSYLTTWEKINCVYCGYANGFLHYATTIAAETEKYWCGIKHVEERGYIPPAHHKNFLPYGDQKAFEEFISKKPTEEKDTDTKCLLKR
jgi:hypothetical protein